MNHIQNIEIQNFKSIKHCVIDGCKRINVFVGPPNVGKSNILEALSTYHFFNYSKLKTKFDQLVRVKKFPELFFDGEFEVSNFIGINNNAYKSALLLLSNNELEILYTEKNTKQEPFENRVITKEELFRSFRVLRENKIGKGEKNSDFIVEKMIVSIDKEYDDLTISLDPPEFNIKKYQFVENDFNNEIDDLRLEAPNGNNLFEVISNNRKVRNICKKLFSNYNLKLLFDKNENVFKLAKEAGNDEIFSIPFYQVADTLQRLIFHLAAIITNEKSVLLLEEPEAQMYPPYISKLTGEIIADENNNQYFIATHSPFVINDFLEEAREDLAIYLVYEKEGETKVQRMTVEEMHEAYQFGSSFFMNIPNFIKD